MQIIEVRAVSTNFRTLRMEVTDKAAPLDVQKASIDGKDVEPRDFLLAIKNRMAGEMTDKDFWMRVLPPVVPDGFERFVKWHGNVVEFGIRHKTGEPDDTAGTGVLSQMPAARLIERAAELGVATVDKAGKQKPSEQLISEIAAAEAVKAHTGKGRK